MSINPLFSKGFYSLTSASSPSFVADYISLLRDFVTSSKNVFDTPIFSIEFLGTPESGKTTTLKELVPRLEQRGLSVHKNRESAEILPTSIKKGSIQSHLWMKNNTIANYINSLQNSNSDIIFLDRGIVDTLLWDNIFESRGDINHSQVAEIRSILKPALPNLVVVLMVTPEESIRRRGGEGHIVTQDFIKQYNESILSSIKSISDKISYKVLFTDNMSVSEVVDYIENLVLKFYHKNG